jgi:hypothetical protein
MELRPDPEASVGCEVAALDLWLGWGPFFCGTFGTGTCPTAVPTSGSTALDPSGGGMFLWDEAVEREEDCATLVGINLAFPLACFFVGCSCAIESLLRLRLPNALAEGITGTEASSVRLGTLGATEATWGLVVGGIVVDCERLLGKLADCRRRKAAGYGPVVVDGVCAFK